MARPARLQPTEGELEILKLLWEQGPCELGSICNAIRQHREVATTTVATMLKVMLDKNLAKRVRGARAWLWSAKVSREATSSQMLQNLVDHVFDGSAGMLVSHLVDDGKLTAAERRQIRELLDASQAATKPSKRSDRT
jgi:BlaI family transcriptional regulator, penicillinase repressor